MNFEIRNVLKIAEERTVETIKNDKFCLVNVVAPARAASEHLLPQNARFNRAQKDDEFQRGYINTGRKHIDGHDNFWIRTIAKFPNALKRPINIWITGNFLNKVIALIKNVATNTHELIRVRRVRQIVDCKDQGFGEATGFLFVLVGMFCNFLNDFAVTLWGSDVVLDR